MTITLADGRGALWQWDTGRRAKITDDTGAYTVVQQDFIVHKRAKPSGYVYTPTDQMTLRTIQRQIGDLAGLTTEAKDTLVAAINEAARTGGGAGSMGLRVADGYIQYSADGGSTWANLIAMAELKGADGAPGKDGHSPVVTATKSGKTTTINVDGAAIATVEDGADGKPGAAGATGPAGVPGKDGKTPVRGTDYWTAADKQEIVNSVIAALPDGTEVSY